MAKDIAPGIIDAPQALISRVPLICASRRRLAYCLTLYSPSNDEQDCINSLTSLVESFEGVDRLFLIVCDAIKNKERIGSIGLPENVSLIEYNDQENEGHIAFDGVTFNVGWDTLYQALPQGQRELSLTESVVMHLLSCLRRNADLPEIVDALKADPALQLKLLSYLNNVYFSTTRKRRTYEHLVMQMGYRALEKWIGTFLLWSPMLKVMPDLHRTAIVRGRLMEKFAEEEGKSKYVRDTAFFVGVLSMLPDLLGVSMESIVGVFSGDDIVVRTLVHGDGELVNYLNFAKATERGRKDDLFEQHGLIHVAAPTKNKAMLAGIKFADQFFEG